MSGCGGKGKTLPSTEDDMVNQLIFKILLLVLVQWRNGEMQQACLLYLGPMLKGCSNTLLHLP